MSKQQLKHLLALWRKVLEKLTVAEVVEKSPLFYGNTNSYLCSQEYNTCPTLGHMNSVCSTDVLNLPLLRQIEEPPKVDVLFKLSAFPSVTLMSCHRRSQPPN